MGSLREKLNYLDQSIDLIKNAASRAGLRKSTFRLTAQAVASKIRSGEKAYKFRKLTISSESDALGRIDVGSSSPTFIAQLLPVNGYICACDSLYLTVLCQKELNYNFNINFDNFYDHILIIGDDNTSYEILSNTIRAMTGTIHFKGKYKIGYTAFMPPVTNPSYFLPSRGIIWGECESCVSQWVSTGLSVNLTDKQFKEYTGDIRIVCTAPIVCDTYFQNFSISQSDLVGIIDKLEQTTTAKTLQIGTDNLAKLTQEQIDVATNKGWTIK